MWIKHFIPVGNFVFVSDSIHANILTHEYYRLWSYLPLYNPFPHRTKNGVYAHIFAFQVITESII